MSAMWPEPPKPGRGYPHQRWVRPPRWPTIIGALGLVLLVAACVASCWVDGLVLP